MPRKLLVPLSTEESPMTNNAGTGGGEVGVRNSEYKRVVVGTVEDGEGQLTMLLQ